MVSATVTVLPEGTARGALARESPVAVGPVDAPLPRGLRAATWSRLGAVSNTAAPPRTSPSGSSAEALPVSSTAVVAAPALPTRLTIALSEATPRIFAARPRPGSEWIRRDAGQALAQLNGTKIE